MKHILLALVLVCSMNNVFAQKPIQMSAKEQFENNIMAFDIYTSRKHMQQVDYIYGIIVKKLDDKITEAQTQVQNTTGPTQQANQQKLAAEQQLYSDVKALSADKIGNKESIKAKLQQFSAYF